MNEVLRAFSAITGERLPESGQVLGERSKQVLLQYCFDRVGIAEVLAQHRTAASTKIRRAIACEENLDDFDPREVLAARLYEQELAARGEVDFESMVIRALGIVRRNEHVRVLLHARFPHLVVDEYQDLGGVLHELVIALRDLAGVTVFAVGDIDQSVFGFTGANAEYLTELAERTDFLDVPLLVNYRSGQDIITAAEAALGVPRGRSAREGNSPGDVTTVGVSSSLDAHAAAATRLVQEARDRGVPPERIAILYPQRGLLLNALVSQLERTQTPFIFEREGKLPEGSLSRFIQRSASRAVLNYQLATAPPNETQSIIRRGEAPAVTDLAADLHRLREEASLPSPPTRLTLLRTLQQTLDPRPGHDPESSAGNWLELLRTELDLSLIASGHPNRDNEEALDEIIRLVQEEELALQDLARATEVLGKVALTTYHSAKGREFDTVILPGLVNGIFPHDIPDRGRWRTPNSAELEEQRRAFYVGMTRAESAAFLIVSPGFRTPGGRMLPNGVSRFVVEMHARLKSWNQND
jgi:DNA helicase-2/ATP-dependent DNA helicase PcrA